MMGTRNTEISLRSVTEDIIGTIGDPCLVHADFMTAGKKSLFPNCRCCVMIRHKSFLFCKEYSQYLHVGKCFNVGS